MKKTIQIISFILLSLSATAQYKVKQTAFLKIGEPCPDLSFDEVHYDGKTMTSVHEYKGKWLILDFWNKGCATCVEKMPGMDRLQKAYLKEAKVLLVGYIGSQYRHKPDSAIRSFYKEIRKRDAIDLPVAYDSLQFHRLAIGACPYVVVVDPQGIVRAVTTRFKQKDLETFLAGSTPHLDKATNRNGL